ncbi:MAG TPA: DNA gyrase subunit A [Saprospiraceae bacterium]|nr:DNA gyrase subunit A [Saprospiraceae bacterium]
MADNQRIIPINIEDEMKSAYIDYSMSVIVARALPDVRDGLKPVHRRVLFGMHELGVTYNKAHKKSARIVGEVLGKYHPHGDASVYDTMVRMAQEWSLRYPLIDGQGNFGSMDGDSPAAMRYTEARLRRVADEMLADLEKETVDFTLNFDDSLEEPSVLPARLPNLLVNGASGIAVGMATNMMPHNLAEVVDGIIATVDKPDITTAELMEFVKAPDFPTGGIIYGYEGVREAFETGRGRVVVRGKADIQEDGRNAVIIITEIPYQVNKAGLVAKIAELIDEKRIEGISDIRDESDREGLRIVVELRRDAIPNVVLSQLYKFTPLQSSFSVNNVALVNGRPMTLTLKDQIEKFITFRLEVIVRRTQYELRKALERAHILIGLLIALDYLDAVIELIRNSPTPDDAKQGLMRGDFIKDKEAFWQKFGTLIEMSQTDGYEVIAGNVLSEAQAKAILEMRLQRLTGLERDKVRAEYDEILKQIEHLRALLENETLQRDIIKHELTEIKERFGDARRTEINFAGDGEINLMDLIEDESVAISISHLGYIKRTPLTEYRAQGRGGRGSRGAKTKDEDFVEHLFIASNHNYILFFTEQGRCYWLRVYEIPEATKNAGGRIIQNVLSIPKDDKVKAYIIIEDLTYQEFLDNHYIMFCTRKGIIKKTQVEAFSRPRAGGINALTIHEGDQLLEARLTNGVNEVFIATRYGMAIRFNESKVRAMGRGAAGVRGVTLEDEQDAVVGMVCIDSNDKSQTILVLTESGNGKRSDFDDYRLTNRGGKGVKTMQVTAKTGNVVAIKNVCDEDELMIITRSGITIRTPMRDIRVMGRATQGVRVIRLDEDDAIADVAVVPAENGDTESVEV